MVLKIIGFLPRQQVLELVERIDESDINICVALKTYYDVINLIKHIKEEDQKELARPVLEIIKQKIPELEVQTVLSRLEFTPQQSILEQSELQASSVGDSSLSKIATHPIRNFAIGLLRRAVNWLLDKGLIIGFD